MAALMSLMQLVTYNCPACGEEISLLMRADSAPGDNTRLDIEVDAKPIQDHIDQHLLADTTEE